MSLLFNVDSDPEWVTDIKERIDRQRGQGPGYSVILSVCTWIIVNLSFGFMIEYKER